MISFKLVGPIDCRKSIYFVMFFSLVSSVRVPYRSDTIRNRAQLDDPFFFDHHPFITKYGKQVHYKELESAVPINLGNPTVGDVIKSVELNDRDSTLISGAITTGMKIVILPEFVLSIADDIVCYDELGCITRFSFPDPILWPINLLPEPRNKIDTHFTLNTRDQSTSPPGIRISANDPIGITAASFKASRPTKFYVHGWLSTGYEDLYKIFMERLLKNGDFNVIVVHWGGGALTSYNQAYVNARLVGLEIAYLVNTLIDKLGVKASDVHLIGHSFGAHISGYAGEKIPNLGRITGLDPAGWYFRGMPTFVRLDPSDAQFVDVIHTDGNGSFAGGFSEPAGHVDFYPNGGGNQPGCLLTELPTVINPINLINSNTNYNNIDNSVACSHMRALYLYSESLLCDGCQNIGFECPDYVTFLKGQCTSCGSDNKKCAPFGLRTDSYPIGNQVNVKFYFQTGESFPFCRYHYAVNVSLAKPSVAKPTVIGILVLSISDGQACFLSNVELPMSNFEHGNDHQFLLTVPSNIGLVQRVNLSWKYVATHLLDVSCFWGVCNQRLYVNSVTISSMNSYPSAEGNIQGSNTYYPQFAPGVISEHLSLDLRASIKQQASIAVL